VLRDVTERVIIASKGSFARAKSVGERKAAGLPHVSTQANDEFVDVTRDVWTIDAESASRVGHPAPFPVELPRRLIDLYTYADDLVLDPFMGSGTSLVAAARTGRIGVGFDLDPAYVDLAEGRLAAEFEREDRLSEATSEQPDALEVLAPDERQDHFHRRAVDEGRKINDIAEARLAEAGFTVTGDARLAEAGIDFESRIVGPGGNEFWIELAGSFVTSRPGLLRPDAIWKVLGKLHLLAELRPGARAIVLTSNVPRPGSPGHKALRAIGQGVLFDVIELYDPAALRRLAIYSEDESPEPLPGFWPVAKV